MNHGELKTAIANHMHRTDLSSIVADFVVFAETTIQNDPNPSDMDVLCGIRASDQILRYTATINEEYETLATDILSVKSAKINGDPDTTLEYLSPQEMVIKYPSSLTGTPQHYSIEGGEFHFKPIPSGDFTLQLSYVQRYAALSADSDTNWLLTNHPMAYVYSACVAASAYLDVDPMQWAMMYKSVAKGINGTADKGQHPARISTRISTATP